ncbi:MAG: hypothetical protein IJ589_10655 [Lachnospiraceae bacterium]|nr:hypothetical protein [Lachnospiraceae bacterium]
MENEKEKIFRDITEDPVDTEKKEEEIQEPVPEKTEKTDAVPARYEESTDLETLRNKLLLEAEIPEEPVEDEKEEPRVPLRERVSGPMESLSRGRKKLKRTWKRRHLTVVAVLFLTLLAVLAVLTLLIKRDKNPVLSSCQALVRDLSAREDYLDEETGYMATFQDILSGYGHAQYDVKVSNIDLSGLTIPDLQEAPEEELPDLLPGEEDAKAPYASSVNSLASAEKILKKMSSRLKADLSGDIYRDPENKVLSANTNINAFSMDVASVDLWAKDKDLYLILSPLMDEAVTFSSEHIGEQVNGSGTATYLGLDTMPDLSLPLYIRGNLSDIFGSEFFLKNAGDIEAFLMNMELADTPVEDEITLNANTTRALLSYEMKTDREKTNALLYDMAETLKMTADQDLTDKILLSDPVLNFAVDDEDRIKVRRISTAEPLLLQISEESGTWEVTFDLKLTAEAVPSDRTQLTLHLKGPAGENWDLTMETVYSQTKSDALEKRSGVAGKQRAVDFNVTSIHNGEGALEGYPKNLTLEYKSVAATADHSLTYDINLLTPEDTYEFYVEAEILDYGKDTLTLDLRHVRLLNGEDMLFGLTGDLKLDTKKDDIPLPDREENAISVFTLSVSEAEKLFQGYLRNLSDEISRYMSGADLFGFGFGR